MVGDKQALMRLKCEGWKIFARLHSADHKSLMLLLRMIMLKVDIGTESGTISEQDVNT